jgi:hypothetical protein
MPGTGPALKPGEADGVIEFVIKRARLLKKRKFKISLDELKPLLTGAIDEGHYINRIRWKMRDQFRAAKIIARVDNDDGPGYHFTLDDSIDIDSRPEVEEVVTPDLEPVKTSTVWKEDYVAPAWFGDVMECLKAGDKPILVGPQGCGKSRALEESFARLGREPFRVALGEYRDPADLIGTKEIVNVDGVPTTQLVGGLVTEGLKNAWGVILDELDMCAPNMFASLNKLMEEGIEVVLQTENGIIKFRPDPNALIAATANTWGYGDDAGEFAGAQRQNRASWDRLRPKIDCDYDYAIERLIVSRHLPTVVVDALYSDDPNPNKRGLIRKIRERIADDTDELVDTMGMRTIIWFAQRWKVFGWHKGMYYFLNDFQPHNRDTVSGIITTRLGNEFLPSRNDFDEKGTDYIPKIIGPVVDAGFAHC